jgi:phage protein D
MIVMRGRDYTGALIDSIVTFTYKNMTSSQVAAKIAANHPELKPKITATHKKVGSYFNNETNLESRKISEWDLLTQLAQDEGFVILIRGTQLYFGQPEKPNETNPYIFKYVPRDAGQVLQSNVLTLKCTRALTVARDVKVVVQSFSRATGKKAKAEASALNPLRNNRTGNKAGTQIYSYNIPNKTHAQCQDLATAYLKQITKRERVIEISAPGDPLLTDDTVMSLTGTNTAWDQFYFADRIEHELNANSGWLMRVRAKNHSTSSTLPT